MILRKSLMVTMAVPIIILSPLVGLGIVMISPHIAYSWTNPDTSPRSERAPIAASGDNIYIVWWTDKNTANSNGELMFRASTDGGSTFGDKINLSNTDEADSVDAEIIASEGDQ